MTRIPINLASQKEGWNPPREEEMAQLVKERKKTFCG
jgi:hypothetical protein